mgnify:CR=1 FL=1
MFENTVVLTKEEYADLLAKAERISTLERMFKASKYVSIEEVATVLGIEMKVTDDE